MNAHRPADLERSLVLWLNDQTSHHVRGLPSSHKRLCRYIGVGCEVCSRYRTRVRYASSAVSAPW
jgi:hypothetical protein